MERRTIDELVARYELEPELADVFVEGPSDRAFIEWIANEMGLSQVKAYEIDSVEVPAGDIIALGWPDNNRARVRYAATELERRSETDLYNMVAAVIDADHDRFLDASADDRLLIVTEYTSPDLYLCSERPLCKLLSVVFKRSHTYASAMLRSITPILREAFLVRTAAFKLSIELPHLEVSRLCSVKGGAVVFDKAEYISRFIRRGPHARRHGEFLAAVAALEAVAVADVRIAIHGHDFMEMVLWYCREVLKVRSAPASEQFRRMFRACLERGDVEGHLTSELHTRFGDHAA